MAPPRTIDEIVETLKNGKDRGRGCTLLIGAGASVTAGIPTAAGFVDLIQKQFPYKYGQVAEPRTYPKCMGQLLPDERRGLISKFVDAALINWAHVCIALLIQNGYVDRVLTTNFDPLVAKACALLGVFPAVYDFAASQLFKAASLPDQAIFHLHGQRTGFVLLNTQKEVERLSKASEPVFENAGEGRTWIVVGYSGEQDPVFTHLADIPTFDNGLYWVSYKDQEPAEHVRNTLLSEGKEAFHVAGFDADSFFITLCQKLAIFPPKLVARPFTHLAGILAMFAPYQLPGQSTGEDVTRIPREWISRAVQQFEEQVSAASLHAQAGTSSELEELPDALVAAATELVMSGQYREALAFRKVYEKRKIPRLGDMLAWAHIMLGLAQIKQLPTASQSEDADKLFAGAEAEFQLALDINPRMSEALTNWGNILGDQAKTKTGEEADRLYQSAGEKYAEALTIKPNDQEVLYSWAITLGDQAKTKTGDPADRLYALSGENYAAAVKLKPDYQEALYNWGNLLGGQAAMKTGEQADRLYALAGEKYAEALRINPGNYEAFYNWGIFLNDQAKTKTGEEADRLYILAGEKYAEALKSKPDYDKALHNWGNLLGDQAKTKTGEEADRLYTLAGEKYAAALKIQPDKYIALYSWGITLSDQAATKTGEAADRLYVLAGTKYGEAAKIKPDSHEAFYNWGSTLRYLAKAKAGEEADRLYELAAEKYAQALKIKPDKYVALYGWGLALADQARTKTGEEADRLYALAEEKHAEALRIKPDYLQALSNWGNLLGDQANTKTGEEADRLYALAGEKYGEALKIKPDYEEGLNNWGITLKDQAKTKTGDEAQRLLALADEKFKIARTLSSSPDEKT